MEEPRFNIYVVWTRVSVLDLDEVLIQIVRNLVSWLHCSSHIANLYEGLVL